MKKSAKSAIKTEWNLGLLYPGGHKDPAIEQDMVAIEAAYEGFARRYVHTTEYTKTEDALFAALQDYENLIIGINSGKPAHYFGLVRALNAQDAVAEAELTKLSDRFTKSGNKIVFFDLALGKIVPELQAAFLKSEKLKPYRYFLQRIFLTAKYNLTEAEEKILSLYGNVSRGMWIDGVDKLVSKKTIIWKKKEIPLPEAMGMLGKLPSQKDRRAIQALITACLKDASDFAESELNAVYTNKKISDELRGFKNPYDSRLLSDEVEESMVNALIKTVQKYSAVAHRFLKLKAKLLKLPHLEYSDRNVGIGKTTTKISFEKGVEIVRAAFARMDPHFAEILDGYLAKGQIDVFPKKGKGGGAFCSGGGKAVPTFILLNHLPDMQSTMTLAHELGHGIHFEMSSQQPVLYEGCSTAVAEVASTFFEQVVFDDVFPTLSAKEKIIALHDRINDSISTIFRQVACYSFELALHEAIRTKGFVQKEEIAQIMNDEMKSYLGPAMKLKLDDGYFFVSWSHIRNFFYVYTYAYGDLVSKALYANYKKDPKFIEKIKQFLSAGSSKSPYDIFKDIGIDTSDPKFFEDGIKEIEKDIILLEKLTQKKPAQKKRA